MEEFAAQRVGEAGRVAGPAAVGPAARGRAEGGSSAAPRVPGLDEFDRLELASVPNAPQVYAQFSVSQKTGVVSIKIMDARTGDVVREIPSEEVLKLAEELQAYIEAGHRRGRRL
jgi:flagellar protein FlaG